MTPLMLVHTKWAVVKLNHMCVTTSLTHTHLSREFSGTSRGVMGAFHNESRQTHATQETVVQYESKSESNTNINRQAPSHTHTAGPSKARHIHRGLFCVWKETLIRFTDLFGSTFLHVQEKQFCDGNTETLTHSNQSDWVAGVSDRHRCRLFSPSLSICSIKHTHTHLLL